MTRISDEWSYRGFPSVVLENRRIRVVVLPGVGARVLSFIDKENDADLLWHHPRRSPEPVVFGSASADVWWTGGIDDIFPTDFPCLYRNEQLPYLGELWTNAWEYRLEKEKNDVALTLVTRTAVSPFEVRKTLGCMRMMGSSRSTMSYRTQAIPRMTGTSASIPASKSRPEAGSYFQYARP
jgi:hypothetical protein